MLNFKATLLPFFVLLWILAWPAMAEDAPPVFSGKWDVYSDSVNGFKLKIPVEFQNTNKGANTTWNGPQVDRFATTIFVNSTPMPGVHPQALYDGIIRAKKADRSVTAVTPVKMEGKLKGKPIYAFSCKEVDVKPGTKDKKDATDHHRWFLYIWGNDTAYELCVAGSFQNMGGKDLPPVFTEVIKSFSLIPIK